jgi:hypothetical protein
MGQMLPVMDEGFADRLAMRLVLLMINHMLGVGGKPVFDFVSFHVIIHVRYISLLSQTSTTQHNTTHTNSHCGVI